MRALWLAIGVSALVLGAIGVVLPLLPTTPFVLVAAFAFGKSSPRLAGWLERSRAFGPAIADWREHRAISVRAKALAVAMMAAVLVASVAMEVSATVLVVQAVCIAGAAAFVLSRPSGPRRQGHPRSDGGADPDHGGPGGSQAAGGRVEHGHDV